MFAFIGGLRGPELLIILVVVLLLFGAAKLPQLARSVLPPRSSARVSKMALTSLKRAKKTPSASQNPGTPWNHSTLSTRTWGPWQITQI